MSTINKESTLVDSLFLFFRSAINFYGFNHIDIMDGKTFKTLLSESENKDKPYEQVLLENLNKFIANHENAILNMMIWFPEFYITNSTTFQKHKIRDFYVSVNIDVHNLEYPHVSLSGNRGTYTYDEAVTGYVHSHIASNINLTFDGRKSFCLGTTAIKNIVGKFGNELTKSIKEPAKRNEFILKSQLFLTEIKNMIQVESTEGGPYIRISSIGRTFSRQNQIRLSKTYIISSNINTLRHTVNEELVKVFLENMKITPYFSKTNSYPIITFNRTKILYLIAVKNLCPAIYNLVEMSPENPDVLLHTSVVDNSNASIRSLLTEGKYFHFKGEKRRIKIIGHPNEPVNSVFQVSPVFYTTIESCVREAILFSFLKRK